MSVNGHEQPGLPDWSEPRVPKVRLTHRNIHFLIAPGDVAMQASVIVGLSHRNHPSGLNEALRSAMAQDMADDLAFLVLDDSSDEGWMQSLHADLLSDPRLVVAAGHFGSPTQSRNGLLDLVDECFPNAKWVARLDADDRFAEPSSLRALVQAGDQRGTLGWSDHELARRRTPERQVEALSALPGFDTYYGELMRSLHPACALDTDKEVPIPEPSAHPDVTLLIKCCPQDASSAHLQVQHLVSELGMRARFAKRVLLIDPFEGPYLRQFAEGDLSALRVAASQLHQSGFIDEVWVAPTDRCASVAGS